MWILYVLGWYAIGVIIILVSDYLYEGQICISKLFGGGFFGPVLLVAVPFIICDLIEGNVSFDKNDSSDEVVLDEMVFSLPQKELCKQQEVPKKQKIKDLISSRFEILDL